MKTWRLREAKAGFFRLLRLAQQQGPQHISHNGKPMAVLMSRADFDRLHAHEQSFVDFMRQSPLHGLEDIDFERDRSLSRDVTI